MGRNRPVSSEIPGIQEAFIQLHFNTNIITISCAIHVGSDENLLRFPQRSYFDGVHTWYKYFESKMLQIKIY